MLKTIGLLAVRILAAIGKVFEHLSLSNQLMHFMDPYLSIIHVAANVNRMVVGLL